MPYQPQWKRIGMSSGIGSTTGQTDSPRNVHVGSRGVFALGIATLFALALAGVLYPLSIQYLTDLGECANTCLAQAQQSVRTTGLLVLLPFLLMGTLLTWGTRPGSKMARSAPWVVLLGGYVAFFPVVYWAGPSV